MKIALRVIVIPALIWAGLAPGNYGFLSFYFHHWSAWVDLAVLLACIILAAPPFKRLPFTLWLCGLIAVSVTASLGFFHHFQDSGESMPLPFEWLNGYWTQALPLVLVSVASVAILSRCNQKPTENEHGGRTTASTATNEPAVGGSI